MSGWVAGREVRTMRKWRARVLGAVVVALTVAGVLAAMPPPASAAAAATVGNGLTTTDLSAVGMSPASLASSLVGPGVTVSNVTYSGANAQAGTIHLVDPAVVSFNDGVILSSGNIADVMGPNKSDSTTGDMAGPADADLNALIANTQTVNPVTFDAASLEFDFVPTSSQVYFTYTFGSDEYLEWVNLFNDVFAFYVNGQNCATVPTGQPVSIDTINSAVNPNLFRDNSFSSPPTNPINIEPDGLSVEMICSAPVQAGQTNHMKLAIADTSDQILDSVVMIKAHSLSVTMPESCNDGVDNDGDHLVDGNDDSCTTTTTPPPPGSKGIGTGGNAPPFTGNEGTPIPLDASALGWTATPDTVTTSWTVTGINGTVGTCEVVPAGPQPVNADLSIPVADALCPNEGEYVARVSGQDIEGKSSFDMDVDFFVHNAPPAVTIDAPAAGATATIGEPVSVSATVTDPGVADAVTCEIDWGDGTAEPGTLAGGTCTGSHAYAAAGAQVISVTATDDAADSAASATVVTVTDQSVVLTSSADPSVKGQPVTLTATTTLGTTGSMSFFDGTTLLGTRTVSGGSAAFTTTALTVGTHSVTASYAPAPGATPSVSSPLVQQVNQAASAVSLSSNVNPSVSGQQITIKAAVSTVTPGSGGVTGTVSFYDNGTLVGTRALFWSSAAIAVKPTAGTHTYTATYNGSTTNLPATTATGLVQQVNQAASAITLTSSVNPTVSGQQITVKATVSTVAPGSGGVTGTVAFYDNGTLVGTRALSWNSAAIAVKPTAGTHTYTATYNGSTNNLPATTATGLVQQVNQAASAITLTSSANPSVAGQPVTIKATVSTVAPGSGGVTGTVAFYDNGMLVATRALFWNSAAIAVTPTVGTHAYTVIYSGSTNHLGSSTATPLLQVVT